MNWADFPAIAENNGSILTNVLQKSAEGTYTYDIRLQLFSKQKNTWKKAFSIICKKSLMLCGLKVKLLTCGNNINPNNPLKQVQSIKRKIGTLFRRIKQCK